MSKPCVPGKTTTTQRTGAALTAPSMETVQRRDHLMPKGIPGRAICSIEDCDRFVHGHGWCEMHLERWRVRGDPLYDRYARFTDPAEALAARTVKDPSGCLIWTGSVGGRMGYGRMHFAGTRRQAHRVSYELARGPIPADLHLDHLCRTPACVNPDHLEPVTPAENNRRAAAARSR